jgi:hypothetical protein
VVAVLSWSIVTSKAVCSMSLEKEILKVLAYFDIFNYPVSATEIRQFSGSRSIINDFQVTLERLLRSKTISTHDGYYFLGDDPTIVKQREIDNKRAENLIKTAYKISSFLFHFPYVRGIGISGSLSKNVANENTDIDFFVITKANRLWIARTAMHLFKKLSFIVGRQHWFCMNYYIDESALIIPEKNIFTATEVVTLLPVCGNGTLKRFFAANDWTQVYFPNYELNKHSYKDPGSSMMKRATESVFNNSLGEWLDNFLMRLTSTRWLQKELSNKTNVKGNRMGLLTGKHFSRPNPVFFQEKVLRQYESKLREINKSLQTEEVLDQPYFSREII